MTAATTPTDEAYSEGAVMVNALGNHPKAKILVALLGDHDRDLNASDIANMAGIERSTFYTHIDTLLDFGLVKLIREVGNSKMYAINKESDAAKALAQFEWDLLDTLDEDGSPAARVDETGRVRPLRVLGNAVTNQWPFRYWRCS
jgi:DNA-binding transcriptional ArsR family regulator